TWPGRPALKLLVAKEVAEQLRVKERTVERLGLPVVRVGAGRGVKRYRQEDVDDYINSRIKYQGGNHGQTEKAARRLLPGGKAKMGLPGLLTRDQLQKIRMGNTGGSNGGLN